MSTGGWWRVIWQISLRLGSVFIRVVHSNLFFEGGGSWDWGRGWDVSE